MTSKTNADILSDIRARKKSLTQTKTNADILSDIRARAQSQPTKKKRGGLTLEQLKDAFIKGQPNQEQNDIDDFDRAMDVIH